MNTAVRITTKGGLVKEFASLEEAAEKTNLSIQALKLRANRNSVPKDGTKVEWIDEHTKKSFKAKQSKRKGNAYELQIIHELTDLGFEGLRSSRSESKTLDNSKIDIYDSQNVLDCYIQCKKTKNTPNIESISNDCPLKDKPLVVFWHKEEAQTKYNDFVLLPKSYFYKLLTK